MSPASVRSTLVADLFIGCSGWLKNKPYWTRTKNPQYHWVLFGELILRLRYEYWIWECLSKCFQDYILQVDSRSLGWETCCLSSILFWHGVLFQGKGGPPVFEKQAQHLPRPGRGFVRPPVCPKSPTVCSPYGIASGGHLTNYLHQMSNFTTWVEYLKPLKS